MSAKAQYRAYLGIGLLFAAVIAASGWKAGLFDSPPAKTERWEIPRVQYDQSEAMQKRRAEFIGRMMNDGIIARISQKGNYPHLYVRPGFYDLDYAEKERIASIVAVSIWTITKDEIPLMVYDSQTNKIIGQFHPVYGFRLD